MKIDLRYDVGNKERFINTFPWIRLAIILLFIDLPVLYFRYLKFKIKNLLNN